MTKIRILNYDPYGDTPENMCEDTHEIQTGQDWFRPDYSPFFTNTLMVFAGNGARLTKDDYKCQELVHPMILEGGKTIHQFVQVTNPEMLKYGKIRFRYMATGSRNIPISIMNQIIDDIKHNKNPIDYDKDIISRPETLPGIDHLHDVRTEISNFDTFIRLSESLLNYYQSKTKQHYEKNQSVILGLAADVVKTRAAVLKEINEHDQFIGNAHGATAAEYGFTQIRNLPLATPGEDRAGITGQAYSTPAGLGLLIQETNLDSPLLIKPGDFRHQQWKDGCKNNGVMPLKAYSSPMDGYGAWRELPSGEVLLLNNRCAERTEWVNFSNQRTTAHHTQLAEPWSYLVNTHDDRYRLGLLRGEPAFHDKDTGFAFPVNAKAISLTHDWMQKALMFVINKEAIILLPVNDAKGNPTSIQAYRGSFLGLKDGQTLIIRKTTFSRYDDQGVLSKELETVQIIDIKTDGQNKYVQYGERFKTPIATIKQINNWVYSVSTSMLSGSAYFKILGAVTLTENGKSVNRIIESTFRLTEGFDLLFTSVPGGSHSSLEGFDINKPDSNENDSTVNNAQVLWDLITAKGGATLVVTLGARTFGYSSTGKGVEFTFPYTLHEEYFTRPWIKLVQAKNFRVLEASKGVTVDTTNPFGIHCPNEGFVYLGGNQYPIKPASFDLKDGVIGKFVNTHYVNIAVGMGYAEYVVSPSKARKNEAVMCVAKVVLDDDGIESITLED